MSLTMNDGCPVITGLGLCTSLGQGTSNVLEALLAGKSNFSYLQREGRISPAGDRFIGAEMPELEIPEKVSASIRRTASFSGLTALTVLDEAWREAGLVDVDPARIGLIIGGSNIQQRHLVNLHKRYRDREAFLTPTYALSFMDTDLSGICSEHFNIRGPVHTVGGASASGQLAAIKAVDAVKHGDVDVCIALGALMDVSYWECQAFRAIGAMGSTRYEHHPDQACRPFDRHHDGFIYGESCGAVVVESEASARKRQKAIHARVAGYSVCMDGNRNPDPSLTGECRAIVGALEMAGLSGQQIGYVNPHGTGSVVGDETELAALKHFGLEAAKINTTKSLLGHGLSSAGMVELVTTILQLKDGNFHPCRNLEEPIDQDFNWLFTREGGHVRYGLNMSMGFGGMNTAVCVEV
ncbi:beta-ketoacyl synthase N-terminal-like domain-containing protein [Gynuella sunshinyii]|uniref:3-oxoacyl-(Acyl-carrier-protein) synthase n=1 Tax=Gynuella sunshinyii YC6258 TaxID=1445510 RepID=A0A0C5VK87_9GAMM|nr:beta-ketoacyl synthase N-terminal-like domain-containing protein [Gynuella sunshinyii]AJQ95107.1 3-oxoacyl-(acyl-carrier-protein) synthase [Gynuella sunshinyii YC6258]DAC80082.1 TPA_exp: ketosynthase [Gynuella sunshinyii YC6258]